MRNTEPFKMYTIAYNDIHETDYWSTKWRCKFCTKFVKLKVTGMDEQCILHHFKQTWDLETIKKVENESSRMGYHPRFFQENKLLYLSRTKINQSNKPTKNLDSSSPFNWARKDSPHKPHNEDRHGGTAAALRRRHEAHGQMQSVSHIFRREKDMLTLTTQFSGAINPHCSYCWYRGFNGFVLLVNHFMIRNGTRTGNATFHLRISSIRAKVKDIKVPSSRGTRPRPLLPVLFPTSITPKR